MSFGEFLDALGESALRNYIMDFSNPKKPPEAIHEKFSSPYLNYSIVWTQPAAPLCNNNSTYSNIIIKNLVFNLYNRLKNRQGLKVTASSTGLYKDHNSTSR